MKKKRLSLRLLLAALAVLLCVVAVSATKSPQEFYQELFENLSEQKRLFTITFDDDPAILRIDPSSSYKINSTVSKPLNQMSVSVEADNVALDLAKMNLDSLECIYDGSHFTFYAQYLLDKEQLAWVDDELDRISATLFPPDASEYERVKAVYQYVATNFTYDDTRTKFTDYDGLTTGSMVCQGYALMTSKLLNRAGVPCRFITGWSGDERHGWNLVSVDGKWYCLDVTWDAGDEYATWKHFLVCREEFTGHEWDEVYLSDTFLKTHPLAEKSYETPQIDVLIDGTLFAGLTIRKGKELQLTADCSPLTAKKILWKSSDPAAVSVTEDGKITSVAPGFAYISASVEDDSYISGVLPVTAVDLTSCSPWADEPLNSLYLRQLYPAELCENFRSGIRRDEFAYLAYLWMREHSKQPSISYKPAFSDLEGSEYWYQVLFVSARGIFDGTSDETFSPERLVTREQAAKILNNLYKRFGYSLEAHEFALPTDAAEISDWAAKYVDRMLETQLMLGREDGRFDPKGILTREEAAILFERLTVMTLDRLKGAEPCMP